MKKIMLLLLVVGGFTIASAQWVNGYTRSNGTHVNGYNRSSANYTKSDNYSTKGNTNPYTGKAGTKTYDNYNNNGYSNNRRKRKNTFGY